MKKHLLCFLTFCLISINIAAQDAPRILSVSVAGDGAFISWIQEGDAGDAAVAYRVIQMIEGDMVSIHETADLNTGFYAPSELAGDGPYTFSIATINADGNIVAQSDLHTTVQVSITSDECADPIVIEWTEYQGFDELVEHSVFKGVSALSEKVAVVDGDVYSLEYFLEDGDAGELVFSVQSSPNGVTQVASNLAPVDSCVEPDDLPAGINDLLIESIVVGPNPIQENVNVSYDLGYVEELTLTVFTLDGRTVDATTFVGQSSLSANNWANGVYIYNITDNAGAFVSSGKLVK